jgi:hypothetical protein
MFFDECQKKCEIGWTGITVYSFPHNENGLYSNNDVIADVATKLHEKYPK